MAFDPQRPYNDLPRLPPAPDIETRAILKRCTPARTALAELRLAGELLPDESVLINSISVLEAKDSSEIENIVTTNDDLFREVSLDQDGGNPATKEALRYRRALLEGFAALKSRPLSTRLAIDVCQTIKGIALDIRKTPGTTLKSSLNGGVVYTPPEGESRLRELLADWERYANTPSDIDPLVRMAVLHYQFEAIHPFTDGNGRTGRVLNILGLIQDGLLDFPSLYLSRHILRTKADYYRLLAAVTTEGAWEPWILYMLEAVETTSRWTNDKIRAIRRLMEHTGAWVARAQSHKIYSRDLVDVIFAKPYCRIVDLVDRGIAKRQSASVYLKELVALGVMREEKVGRDKVFVHERYLNLLQSDEHTFQLYFRSGADPVSVVQ